MHMMMQTPKGDDGPCLPHDLSVMKTYIKMTTRSKWVVVMAKNLAAALITITKDIKITQVEAMNRVPQVEFVPGTLEKLDKIQGIQQTRMSVEQRKEMLLQQLELSVLEGWYDKNQAAAIILLAQYIDIFSLEPGEMGCTDLVRHEIRIIDDEPFKERFWRLPPSIADEVHAHVKEILKVGAICPSQSQW